MAVLSGCKQNKSAQTAEAANDNINLIFETDLGNDIDDALALDLIYKYLDQNKVNLLGICLNKEGNDPAEYLDIMNTWYGYPDIPVGIVRNGAYCLAPVQYATSAVNLKHEDGTPMFKRSHSDYDKLPDAHMLYRKILASMPDNSVTIVSVGFSTNLARLLDTPGDEYSPLTGKELVAKKVKMLSVMACNFTNHEHHEYNVVIDVPAAQKTFAEWPGTIVFSPFELGIEVKYPSESIENDFQWAPEHPMVEAYKAYHALPYSSPTWDPTSLLYALEGTSDYFTMSEPGTVEIDEVGASYFTPDAAGNRYYLMSDEAQGKNIVDYFVKVISSLPKNRSQI